LLTTPEETVQTLWELSTSLVAEVLAVAEIKLPLFEVVAAVEAELPVVVETVDVTGEPIFDATLGEALVVALAAEESLALEPPHAASM
jgi:hypothetical protein